MLLKSMLKKSTVWYNIYKYLLSKNISKNISFKKYYDKLRFKKYKIK